MSKESLEIECIYFSPTGGTEKIVRHLTGQIEGEKYYTNLTKPDIRSKPIGLLGNVVVVGVPVYGERIPKMAYECLEKLQGQGQPLIGVVVYGNAGYGIALKQLEKWANNNHFNLIGVAAFVAEHSYASQTMDVALGRPNEKDLAEAENFGKLMNEKLRGNVLTDVQVPRTILPLVLAKFPTKGTQFIIKKPKVDLTKCNHCKICVKHCPTGAIHVDTLAIANQKCIRCYACVKKCPEKARLAAFRFRFMEKIFMRLGKESKPNKIFL